MGFYETLRRPNCFVNAVRMYVMCVYFMEMHTIYMYKNRRNFIYN